MEDGAAAEPTPILSFAPGYSALMGAIICANLPISRGPNLAVCPSTCRKGMVALVP